MSALLTGNLPLIADAPDGIRKLRGLILELAVRGKLVPQDPNDEPASELLKQLAAEKAQLVREGKIKKDNLSPPKHTKLPPFTLPLGWAWARLADTVAVVTDGDHQPPPKTDSGIPFLVIGDLNTGRVTFNGCRFVSAIYFEGLDWSKRPTAGDILYTVTGSFGIPIPVIEKSPFCVQRHVAILKAATSSPVAYLLPYMQSLSAKAFAETIATGTAQKTVPLSGLREMPIALPPVAEQHRIVAKVNELMALCDRLEAEQADAESAHARLVDALLAALTRSTDAADFAANWQRLAAHFDTLFTTEAAIDALKQTVLQLAVRGKLVPQDFKDISATSVSGDADGPPLLALPKGWETTSFGALCEVGGGMTPTKSRDDFWGEGVPWVSPKDMKVDFISESQDQITARALSETTIRTIPSGSLLVVVRGMILAHSFPVAITRVDVTINQDMKALMPRNPEIAPYLMLVCRGFKNDFLNLVERSTHGTCKLETHKLLDFSFGLPPIAEQHRIVAKVDELMALCDRLKANLATARQRQATLADTLIAAVLVAA